MKYILRSVKYFIMFVATLSLFILIFAAVSSDITVAEAFSKDGKMFVEGSFPKILALFIAFAAIYPAMAFVKKEAVLGCPFEEGKNKIIGAFDNSGYYLEKEDDQTMTFKLKSGFSRFMRMYEDAVTVTKGDNPIILNGYRKDIFRLAKAIEYATRSEEEEGA